MQQILSVGIDVGTSTTQVVFSRLAMENSAGFFSVPKVSIVDKQVVYKSSVHLTPLKTDVLIDTEALEQIVAQEFASAGYRPEDTDSGAVIITGESARKENADAVLESLSHFAGDFVVSAAGPDMESVIAGKGSGAWQYSIDQHCRVVNLDIGGGTTNIVVFQDGETVARGCLDIGGRLIRVGRGGILTKVSPSAAKVASETGVSLIVGQPVNVPALEKVVRKMAEVLEASLGLRDSEAWMAKIQTPGSSLLGLPGKINACFFSGGVADLIYQPESDIRKYGDIGVLLGKAIRESSLYRMLRVISPGETIRATVVGAGSYTTTISGSTISYSSDIFPLKNMPVMKLDARLQQACFEGRAETLMQHIRWYQKQRGVDSLMMAMPGKKDPGYAEMKQAAATIYKVMDTALPDGAPILLVIESDIAKAMGQMIQQQPGVTRPVVVIDSIHVEDGEYVDMGKPLMNGMVIPVVVKTLLFG